MKKLLILLAFLPFLTSCENIGPEDRYIEEGDVLVGRNVLLEEFTGQLCTNCPDAHRVLASLEEQYGESLIVVSIHAGKGQFGIASPQGLMLEEGDAYAQRWGVYSYPAGLIDRQGSLMGYKDFSEAVRAEIGKTTMLEMSLEAQFSEDGKNIEVFTTLVTPTSMTGSLQLWVVENNITAMQIDNGAIIMDYVHNNVFRGCVNGLWGEEVPLEGNVVEYRSNVMPVDEIWDPENLEIVGFYYNGSGVVQVEKTEITTKTN